MNKNEERAEQYRDAAIAAIDIDADLKEIRNKMQANDEALGKKVALGEKVALVEQFRNELGALVPAMTVSTMTLPEFRLCCLRLVTNNTIDEIEIDIKRLKAKAGADLFPLIESICKQIEMYRDYMRTSGNNP